MTVRLVVLGNENAGDDGAAILAARALASEFDVTFAGRPGVGLLDLLDSESPTLLADVTRSGLPAGSVVRLAIDKLPEAAVSTPQVSSHGFGPSETIRLGRALGRRLSEGFFVGIEGVEFQTGQPLSPALRTALPTFIEALRAAAKELSGGAGDRPLAVSGGG